eukprot:gene40067-49016_t
MESLANIPSNSIPFQFLAMDFLKSTAEQFQSLVTPSKKLIVIGNPPFSELGSLEDIAPPYMGIEGVALTE